MRFCLFILVFCVSFLCLVPSSAARQRVGESVSFSCSTPENELRRRKVVRVRSRGLLIYAGFRQASGNNKNPILVAFRRGTQRWCREDYERSGDDGTAYGLATRGRQLFAAFTATGTQGGSQNDYRRFTVKGWLPSYGIGGGPKVTVLAKVRAMSGAPLRGTFLSALLQSGKSNSYILTSINPTKRKVTLRARSFFSPRKSDKTAMSCSGASPFDTRVVMNKSLSRVLETRAERCVR